MKREKLDNSASPSRISRRRFIGQALTLGAGVLLGGSLLSLLEACNSPPILSTSSVPAAPSPAASTPSPTPSSSRPGGKLVVVRGKDPAALVEAALAALGGIERFVRAGNDVIIKPNICVAYHTYEYAATTNPEVVGTIVRLCLGAGASRVRVMDAPFGGTPEEAYSRSGIGEAVAAAGGEMEVMSRMKYRETPIPGGLDIQSWPIYQDALEADVLINLPIAKQHGSARLSLGMKNLMGLIQNRGGFHANLGQRIADLSSLLHPTLTIIDAVRILVRNGPTGGSLDDVRQADTVIAGVDPVAADAYAATLFGLSGADIPYIQAGAAMGLGTIDLRQADVEELNLTP